MRNFRSWSVFNKVFVLLITGISLNVSAVVNVDKTRVIFSSGDSAQTINLLNSGDSPTIVQVWTDDGNINISPDMKSTPIISLPPVMKLLTNELRSLRLILASREKMPKDRESLFWLNIYQIPSHQVTHDSAERKVLLPLRIRLKIFIRPQGIDAPQITDPSRIIFSSQNKRLTITNPTPWYMNINCSVDGNNNLNNVVVAPKSQITLPIRNQLKSGEKVHFSVINDNGNPANYVAQIANAVAR